MIKEPLYIATGKIEKLGNSYMFCYLKKSDVEKLGLEGKEVKAIFYSI